MRTMNPIRPRGITIIAILMILFGCAEMVTGFTHNFFGISTTRGIISTYSASGLGALYAVAGLLVLTMRRWAAGLALVCLVVVIVGRIALVATGLFPVSSFEPTFAIVVGTSIAAAFAAYVGSKWSLFR
jgi:hypothetical protein